MTTHRETMTSRQRVLKALHHEEPDRVPLDLGGNQTGIHKFAYAALLRELGLDEEIEIMDAVQQLARPSEAVLERLRIDTRYIHAGAAADFRGEITRAVRDGKVWYDLVDEFGVRWSMPEDSPLYMDITLHPLADATLADLGDYPFPVGNDPGRFAGLRERALRIRQDTPYALVSGISGVVYEICWYMRGLEQWFIDMIEQPQFCEALLDHTLRFWMDWFSAFQTEVGDLVDVIMIGDDIAGQRGPLFQPEFYRSVVKPRQKQLVTLIKSGTQAKIWYHTCGACRS
jgi:uroporphyrinogen decarboxylase